MAKINKINPDISEQSVANNLTDLNDAQYGMTIQSPPSTMCEKVKEFRGSLMANISHDLKTPLQSIIGFSETIVSKHQTISNDDVKRYAEIILRNTRTLQKLTEQLFEYSRMEISDTQPQKDIFPIREITECIKQNYNIICQENKVDLVFNLEKGLPALHVDFFMIYRVFQNMIDNALKFTPEDGTITIDISKYSPEQIQVQISDTGLGIPEDQLDSIFNKFQMNRKITASKRKNDGLGLGLAIVNKILFMHDSKIFVKSKINVGTTFTFFLPLCID